MSGQDWREAPAAPEAQPVSDADILNAIAANYHAAPAATVAQPVSNLLDAALLVAKRLERAADSLRPSHAAPVAQCGCSPDVSLSSYTGGAAPEGLFGRVTLMIDGKLVDYVPATAAPVVPDWQHLKQYGYAPGGYMSRCHQCNAVTHDLDKRAITCRPCAEKLHAEASAPAAPVGDGTADE